MEKSYFDGTVIDMILYRLLEGIIILVTFGFGTPWALCIYTTWEAEHTVIGGKRLYFTGKGADLFITYLKWIFFIIITLGIYSFWVPVRSKQWLTERTHQREDDSFVS